MEPFNRHFIFLGASVASVAIWRGLKKKSLSRSGAMAAWLVGFLSVGSGLRGFVLLIFYQIASLATKYKKKLKESYDATATETGTRGASQVLACSILAVATTMIHVITVGEEKAICFHDDWLAASLTCAIISHHSTCLADTLASELGVLSNNPPVLVTNPFQTVPPGTNGGVTWWGFAASCIGGGTMGVSSAIMDWMSGITPVQPVKLLLLGIVTGLIGSIVDSILGATIQISYQDPDTKTVCHHYNKAFKKISGINILNNVQVNFISIFVTMILGGTILGPMVFD